MTGDSWRDDWWPYDREGLGVYDLGSVEWTERSVVGRILGPDGSDLAVVFDRPAPGFGRQE